MQRLESLCNDQSKQPVVLFYLKTTIGLLTWLQQGGLSCREEVDSIVKEEAKLEEGDRLANKAPIVKTHR